MAVENLFDQNAKLNPDMKCADIYIVKRKYKINPISRASKNWRE